MRWPDHGPLTKRITASGSRFCDLPDGRPNASHWGIYLAYLARDRRHIPHDAHNETRRHTDRAVVYADRRCRRQGVLLRDRAEVFNTAGRAECHRRRRRRQFERPRWFLLDADHWRDRHRWHHRHRCGFGRPHDCRDGRGHARRPECRDLAARSGVAAARRIQERRAVRDEPQRRGRSEP